MGVIVLQREGDRTMTPKITLGRKGVLERGILVLHMGSTIGTKLASGNWA